MLTQDRYRAILDLLEEKNSVTVSELTKLLDSSESTIRRDLSALDEMGKLTKVFGGATSITRNEGVFEDAVSNRETVMSDEKDAVAEYCAKLIHDSDFVYIDAGTTTLKLVDHITNTNATYVTNGITHARMLIHKGMQTYIVGGKIKPLTEAVVGAEAIKSINLVSQSIMKDGKNVKLLWKKFHRQLEFMPFAIWMKKHGICIR